MRHTIIDRISFLVLFSFTVLLPFFFLPFLSVSIETSKGLLLVTAVIISIVCWIAARFYDGIVTIPRSTVLFIGGGAILISTLLSAIFSGSSATSFFGSMLDIGTFWFMLCAFVLMIMVALNFREPGKARFLTFGFLGSAVVLLVFQLLHVFMPKILSLGVLSGKTDTILGTWNAFGIFAGLFVVACLFVYEFFTINQKIKWALGAGTALALFLISLVNFIFIWELVGVFSLVVFIYKISTNFSKDKEIGKINFPIFSFIVIIISLFFFMSSGWISDSLPNKLGTLSNEINPSFFATTSVTKNIIKDHPIFGVGPNKFGEAWALYKPAQVNGTAFWDVSFNSGFGLVSTLAASTGILGIIAWILFFVLFIFAGFKSLFSQLKNSAHLEATFFFLLSLYLFVASFFYFTGTVLFLLAVVFAGVFIGLVGFGKPKGEIALSFFSDHRKSFFLMFFLIILMIVSVAFGFKYVQRFVSVSYFAKAVQAQKVEDAQSYITKALRLNANDLYWRTYSQIHVVKMNSIVSSNSGESALTEAQKAELQSSLDQAVNGAQAAIAYNPKNYTNYEMLGSVLQTAGLLGTEGAYARSVEAYKTAATLNPLNPRILLTISGIQFADKKLKDAKEYANKALTIKPDYVDALLLLSQMARSEGNTSQAISYAEKALAILPTNKDLIKYVDSLKSSSSSSNSSSSETVSPTTDNN